MGYTLIPLDLLQLGKPLPVDVRTPDGRLLMRKGLCITTEQQKEMLAAHKASMARSDAMAWRKSYERMIQAMFRDGMDMQIITLAPMPSEIRESDYVQGREVLGGWLDLLEILRGLLYQGKAAISPLERLETVENKALELLQKDPDQCLFVLFQALADTSLGYCATNALLVGVVCHLTAQKMALPEHAKQALFRAALTMNIGMARDQDSLARQSSMLVEAQRKLIHDHPQHSHDILQGFGVADEDQLDIVRWHHEHDETCGQARNLVPRRILRLADTFVAKMAARKTRLAMSPLGAAHSLFTGATQETANLSSAMTTVTGFYPPGTYVQLINGEKAVAVARGPKANQPHVLSIVNAGGMPLSQYIYHDTADPHFAIRAPLNAEKVKVKVSLEKVLKLRPGPKD